MHEPYKSNMSCKNTFGVKKVQPSKVESYLEVNADIRACCHQSVHAFTLPGMILLYLATPFVHQRCFCMIFSPEIKAEPQGNKNDI